MKIIAITNQKGGTAKTTTAAALAVLLARSGTPTHLIDMDPQASLTRAFGLADETDGLYRSLTDRAGLPVKTVAREPNASRPAPSSLAGPRPNCSAKPGGSSSSEPAWRRRRCRTDAVVLLDCPPSLGVLSVNCLTTAGGMIAVIQPGGFELHALAHLHVTAQAIQERVNPDLHILGGSDHQRPSPAKDYRAGPNRSRPPLSAAWEPSARMHGFCTPPQPGQFTASALPKASMTTRKSSSSCGRCFDEHASDSRSHWLTGPDSLDGPVYIRGFPGSRLLDSRSAWPDGQHGLSQRALRRFATRKTPGQVSCSRVQGKTNRPGIR